MEGARDVNRLLKVQNSAAKGCSCSTNKNIYGKGITNSRDCLRNKGISGSNYLFSSSRLFVVVVLLFTLTIKESYGDQTTGTFDDGRSTLRDRSRHLNQDRARHAKRPNIYLNQYIVNLVNADDNNALALARKYGFVFKGQIDSMEGWYLFEDKRVRKRSLHGRGSSFSMRLLRMDDSVAIVDRLRVLSRQKRGHLPVTFDLNGPDDPAWSSMWYMHCGGPNNQNCPTSMRIYDAWRAGYSGSGVVVTILDDGIERDHPDLRLNYDANASYDINQEDPDPTPRYDHSNENKHGTRCAGVVAAVSDNKICSVGIAYDAKIGGVRMLDGEVTDSVEARSLRYKMQHIDIYSASWGPDDDGGTVEGPGYLAKAAFKEGARRGRGGKGSIFVWASGNGGHHQDTCSCDGYINSIYTIGISSVSQNGKRPWYLESCASTLATTYSSGEVNEGKVITTDLRGTCTYSHTGTSASAPMAAGVIALMLEANANLTWRDVQHIIVRTSNPTGLQARDWSMNGAGFNVSHVFGFGLMDAAQLTHVSKSWITVPEQRICSTQLNRMPRRIERHHPLHLSVDTSACRGRMNEINHLEHVILRITLAHSKRGHLQIFLVSPDGTSSHILEQRRQDHSDEGFDEWDFMTTHHWGENPRGVWTLKILDIPQSSRVDSKPHELRRWHLIFHGTRDNPQPNFSYNSCDAFPQDHCHPECEGCCGPSEMECKRCRHVSTFTGQCIVNCPSGQFAHPRSKLCRPCWRTCKECTGDMDNNCTSCHSGFRLINGRCEKTCTEGYYLYGSTQVCRRCHALCLTCRNRHTKCTSCRNGFTYRPRSSTCEASCPRGTYLFSVSVGCKLCNESCATCLGPAYFQCTSCAPGYLYHKKNCISSCPRRYYADYGKPKPVCRLCAKTCRTCLGSPTNCTSCQSGYELIKGRCQKICRDAFPSRLPPDPCLLAMRTTWCETRLFRQLCCETCARIEVELFFLQDHNDNDQTLSSYYSYDDNITIYEEEDDEIFTPTVDLPIQTVVKTEDSPDSESSGVPERIASKEGGNSVVGSQTDNTTSSSIISGKKRVSDQNGQPES